MTITDRLSEDDLLLLDPPQLATDRGRREPPPGAEAMARPWRLGVVGLGITLGLIARLLAANGYFSINSRTLVLAAAATSLLAGIGLIALAAERDRFDRWMLLLAAGTGVSLGALQWVSPHFSSGTLEWSNADQFALALLGTGNGLLLAGILTLAFARRWPTMTVVGVLAAGVLTLTADSVLLRNEWPAIAALALAFGGVLLAWDQAPRHEPAYPEQVASPRISRAALCLATLALAGSVLQLWISRGESVRRVLPAGVVSAALVLLSFLAMIRIRRELQRRETSINEWTSWMREIRTGDLRNDFETMGTTASGALIGDVTGEAPRPLSFPDLRVEDTPQLPLAPEPGVQPEPEPAPAPAALVTPDLPLVVEPTPAAAPAIDIPDIPEPPEAPAIAVPDPIPPAATPTPEVPAPLEVPTPLEAPAPVEPPRLEPARLEQPRLFGDEPPAASDLVWADDLEDPTLDTPVISDDQPALFDFEAPTDIDTPAPAFSTLLDADAGAGEEPAPDELSGAFSSWLEEADPVAEADTGVGTLDDFTGWLSTTPEVAGQRLVAAVETMSLADFDELPTEVSQAATVAMLERLASMTPPPVKVTAIDGPYLMVGWDDVDRDRLAEINRAILDAMSTPVPTEFGAVGLTGTLALLRPGSGATLDDLIDQAIQGLVQARQLEARAAEGAS